MCYSLRIQQYPVNTTYNTSKNIIKFKYVSKNGIQSSSLSLTLKLKLRLTITLVFEPQLQCQPILHHSLLLQVLLLHHPGRLPCQTRLFFFRWGS